MNQYTTNGIGILAAFTVIVFMYHGHFTLGCSEIAVCGQGCTWSVWTVWISQGTCSVTCGGGSQAQIRNRTCVNAIPSNGAKCSGTSTECRSIPCNNQTCIINGNWSPWGSWESNGTCIETCSGCVQTQNRFRTCTNPRPQNNGRQCVGNSVESQTIECDSQICPQVNGQWCAWSPWTFISSCSVPCGGGSRTQIRARSCSDPHPANGGLRCDGSSTESQTVQCNTQNCSQVDGIWNGWTDWTSIGTCCGTCGRATQNQTRTRSCTYTIPQNCGSQCSGNAMESQIVQCNKQTCPPECSWTDNGINCNSPSSAMTRTVMASRSGGFDCKSLNCTCDDIFYGYIMHPTYCTKFILCAWNTPFVYTCENGTYWDQSLLRCADGTC